jgi:hypothetical protein
MFTGFGGFGGGVGLTIPFGGLGLDPFLLIDFS